MKPLSILAVLLITVQYATAQEKTIFGIKGGLNIVNMAIDDNLIGLRTNNRYHPAFHVGFYELYNFSERVYADLELMYSSKGYRGEGPSFTTAGGADDFRINLHYISAPLLAGYRISEDFSVLLGPEIGYLAAARQRSNGESGDISSIWNRKLDIGATVGVSYLIGERVDLGLRYVYGLLNVVGDDIQLTDERGNPISNDEFESKNRTFQLSLGYRLNLVK